MVTAVACAATFVPFLVCLKPSIPQDLIKLTSPKILYLNDILADICLIPFESVKVTIVLFDVTLILKIGKSLKGIPLNNLLGVSMSGKVLSFLQSK